MNIWLSTKWEIADRIEFTDLFVAVLREALS